MITTKNYFDKVKDIDIPTLPSKLKEGYEFVKEVTENHTTWDYYNSDADIKATIDQFLANLSDYLQEETPKQHTNYKKKTTAKQHYKEDTDENSAREAAKKLIRGYVQRGESVQELKKNYLGSSNGEFSAMIRGNKIIVDRLGEKHVEPSFPLQSIYNEVSEEHPAQKPALPAVKKSNPQKQKSRSAPNTNPFRINTKNAKPVERIDDAIRFIKRYTLMHGKIKTSAQIIYNVRLNYSTFIYLIICSNPVINALFA